MEPAEACQPSQEGAGGNGKITSLHANHANWRFMIAFVVILLLFLITWPSFWFFRLKSWLTQFKSKVKSIWFPSCKRLSDLLTKLCFKILNVLRSSFQWPNLPGTFHILIGKFSYFVIRFLNQIFFVINFSYFVIRFLINSSIVKSDNEIGKVNDKKKSDLKIW